MFPSTPEATRRAWEATAAAETVHIYNIRDGNERDENKNRNLRCSGAVDKAAQQKCMNYDDARAIE